MMIALTLESSVGIITMVLSRSFSFAEVLAKTNSFDLIFIYAIS